MSSKNRRLMAAVAAVLLMLGTALGVWWTAGADSRAMANMQPTQVLVVQTTIPAGTPAKNLGDAVKLVSLPGTAVLPGAVTNINTLGTRVSSGPMNPGEQVTTARFVDPSELAGGGAVELPVGMSELSLRMDIQNAAGGTLKAGDRVGAYATMNKVTTKVASKVLVLRVLNNAVQKSQVTGTQMVVLAVTPDLATQLVNAAAGVWLTKENDKSSTQIPPAAGGTGTGTGTGTSK